MANVDYKAIHETALGNVLNMYDAIGKTVADIAGDPEQKRIDKADKEFKMKLSSIAKQASELTMVFPVLCSRSISIDRAMMISKAVERNCVSMLQKIFSCWQIAASGVDNARDYIAQFHTNLSTQAFDLDDFFRLTTTINDSKAIGNTINGIKQLATMEAATQQAKMYDMINHAYYLPTSISESSINDNFTVSENGSLNVKYKSLKEETEEEKARRLDQQDKDRKDFNRESDYLKAKMSFEDLRDENNFRNGKNSNINNARNIRDRKDLLDIFKNQTLDSDYKKANELIPTNMYINFKVRSPDGSNTFDVAGAVVGVKAKLYPISSEDLVSHIGDKAKAKQNWLVNLVRGTTGEISLMKDLALGIEKARIDAIGASARKKSTDPMWRILERRANSSRAMRSMNQTNNAAAITTLVMSQDEVEYIKKNYNVDLERAATACGLFESYNLLGIVIVDEALEVAKFIYNETDPMWETISFNHLEREASDNTYKKVVNLMTKMSH